MTRTELQDIATKIGLRHILRCLLAVPLYVLVCGAMIAVCHFSHHHDSYLCGIAITAWMLFLALILFSVWLIKIDCHAFGASCPSCDTALFSALSVMGGVETTGRCPRCEYRFCDDTGSWQQFWGESYGPELKRDLLKPVFDKFDAEEKIGNLIIDVGSGASPVTKLLKTKLARKRVCVDVAADNLGLLDELRIRVDAEKVGQSGALSFRKAVVRVCRFLELNPETETHIQSADTIVFADIMNYIAFRKVLLGFVKYLKPCGRIIVLNCPLRGNRMLFSSEGLKDNQQLYAFLEEHHFEIEYKAFPKRSRKETDESEELIVLVAKKCREL